MQCRNGSHSSFSRRSTMEEIFCASGEQEEGEGRPSFSSCSSSVLEGGWGSLATYPHPAAMRCHHAGGTYGSRRRQCVWTRERYASTDSSPSSSEVPTSFPVSYFFADVKGKQAFSILLGRRAPAGLEPALGAVGAVLGVLLVRGSFRKECTMTLFVGSPFVMPDMGVRGRLRAKASMITRGRPRRSAMPSSGRDPSSSPITGVLISYQCPRRGGRGNTEEAPDEATYGAHHWRRI